MDRETDRDIETDNSQAAGWQGDGKADVMADLFCYKLLYYMVTGKETNWADQDSKLRIDKINVIQTTLL